MGLSAKRRFEKLKEEFIASVSHDLRTPLTVIRGAMQNLHDGLAGGMRPRQKRLIEITIQSLEHLTALIEELLDLNRLQSGRVELQKTRVPVSKILRSMHKPLSGRLNGSGIRLQVKAARYPSKVTVDPRWIGRLMVHLIENASFYSKKRICVNVGFKKKCFLIRVADDGLNRQKMPEKNASLPLMICQEIVKAHGGSMRMKNGRQRRKEWEISLP